MTITAPLSPLDLILAAIGSKQRPADFGIVFHLNKSLPLGAMRTGARSARNRYPVSGSVLNGRQWTPVAVPDDGMISVPFSSDAAEAFFEMPFDPQVHPPIQQIVFPNGPDSRSMLVTRIHHAAADGRSAALWLRHQFQVASGLEHPTIERKPFEPVLLRRIPSTDTKIAPPNPKRSQELCTGNSHPSPTSPTRRWLTVRLPGAFRASVLATAAIEMIAEWNKIHGSARRIGLWFPVNVRESRSLGFGNGTSRIRIQQDYSSGSSFAEKCSQVQQQIRRRLRQGEWAVPAGRLGGRLTLKLNASLLRLYLNRPWADVGTAPFSYAGDWSGPDDHVFQHVEKIECVGQLHKRHAVAMNAVTLGGKTWLTFTFDPRQLTFTEIGKMSELYQEQIALAGEQPARVESNAM